MAINGDSISNDVYKRLNKASQALLKNFLKYMAQCKAAFATSMSDLARKRQEAKLMEQYGVTKEFQQYIKKGGTMKSVDVSDGDYLDFSRELKRVGVPYIAADILKDNGKTIRYRECDAEQVKAAIETFKRKREMATEYAPEKFVEEFGGKESFVVKGLDMVELEMLRYYAPDYDFKYTAIATGDNKCDIKFLQDDVQKMDEIMKNIGWHLSSDRALLLRTKIQHRIEGRNDLRLLPDSAIKEYYIVSKENHLNYIKFTQESMQVFKEGHMISETGRDSKYFFDKGLTAVQGLKEPVALKPFEWDSSDREFIIAGRERVIPMGRSAADGVISGEISKEVKEYMAEMSITDGYRVKDYNQPSWEHAMTSVCINNGLEELAGEFTHLGKAGDYLKNRNYIAEPAVNVVKEKTKADRETAR